MAAVAALLISGSAHAQQPVGTAFTFQGQLKDGSQPYDGMANLRFELFDVPAGGTRIGAAVGGPTPVSDGLFTSSLDFGAEPFTAGEARWLQLFVDDQPLTPRQRLTATPFSLATRGISVSATGNVGIGLNAQPLQRLYAVAGANYEAAIRGDGEVRGVMGIGLGDGSGVVGVSSGGGASIFGDSNGTGAALFALSRPASGSGVAVHGRSNSPDGYGGYFEGRGYFSGNLGIGDTNPVQRLTVIGTSEADPIRGVSHETTGEHYAVSAQTWSPQGAAIRGDATGGAAGVYGSTFGGVGVFGDGVSGDNAVGGFFRSNGQNGKGVHGAAYALAGVTYGVVGEASSPDGFGLYSIGNFAATGTKSFQIDHPLDPANKLLNHYCSEGPEPLNLYSGVETLDARGGAVIVLPAYFGEINRDCRYQLTPIGAAMPDLHVAEEVSGNRFRVAGGAPGRRVSWQVSAVRNDAWVREKGTPTEVDKTPEQRASYMARTRSGVSASHNQRTEGGSTGQ